MSGAFRGAVAGWNGTDLAVRDWNTTQLDYEMKWALYNGRFNEIIQKAPYRLNQPVYKNMRMLWTHVEAIVEFYTGNVYRGQLPAEPPAEGSKLTGAIPFVAQSGNDATLLKAIVELFIAWNWQQQMSLRPMYGSVLGDVLTELADDADRGFVYPQIVRPWHVKEIEVDYVNNVQRYVIEHMAEEKKPTGTQRYMFRKEVDKAWFRFYRDDKLVSEYPNAYGFVPAIWDSHRPGLPGEVRGRSAIDGTLSTLLEVNSLLSHAFDFQRKTFFAPMMISSKSGNQRSDNKDQKVDVTAGESGRDEAQAFRVVTVPEGANLLQPQFDIGKTREMLQDIQQGILDENPEARFYQQLRGMTQVATETVRMVLGDADVRLSLASDRYDVNTIKLFQMAIAICGLRANDGSWGKPAMMSARQAAFLPFGLDSYKRGDLDMSIAKRPLVEMTESERLDMVARKESLATKWGMGQFDIDDTTAQRIMDERMVADAGLM